MSNVNQSMSIVGELLIETDLNTNVQEKGKIAFVDKTNLNRVIAGMRIFGTPQSRLIVDSYNSANGLAFRTNINQGTTTEGGTGEDYGAEILSSGICMKTRGIKIYDSSRFKNGPENGTNLFEVERPGTYNVPSVDIFQTRYLGKFYQSELKPNEIVQIGIGSSSKHMLLAFDNTLSKCQLGYTPNNYSAPTFAIEWNSSGNVTIPTNLTAGTINATTYLNLPPADIDPITLDPTNHRVGINITGLPDETLQVGGDCHVDNQLRCAQILCGDGTFTSLGAVNSSAENLTVTDSSNFYGTTHVHADLDVSSKITADTVEAAHYIGLPTQSVLPLTLDTTNNRVGINTTQPQYPLHVVGRMYSSMDIVCATGLRPGGLTIDAKLIAGGANPNGQQSATVGSLYMRIDGLGPSPLYTKMSGTGNQGWIPMALVPTSYQLFPAFLSATVNASNGTGVQNLTSITLSTSGTYTITAYLQMYKTNTPAYTSGVQMTYGIFTTSTAITTTTGVTGFNKAETFYVPQIGGLSHEYVNKTFSFTAAVSTAPVTVYLNVCNAISPTWTVGEIVYGTATGIVAHVDHLVVV